MDNLNRRSSSWAIGDCIDGTEKLINYNHTVCLDALSQLAETYETEYQITETVIEGVHTKTVHLKKVEYNKDNPLTLSYGKGHGFKTGVGRESGDIPPEIILVETTDRNIDYSKYGAKELLMPKSQTIRYDGTRFEGEEGFNASASRTYKTDEYGTSVMRADRELTTSKEDSLDCTEIYPSRVGEVSKVTTINTEKHFYDFYDTGIPNNLNFEDCLIEGEKMTVVFQSGMLSGKEFEVKYTHVGRKFEIIPQEIDGITMPDGGVWMPEVGDKYAVFGIQLPEAYISDNATRTGASWDVFREAVKYLYEHEDKKFTFTGTLDGIWAKKRWLTVGGKIVLGGFVSFTDNQFHPEGSLIRIVGIKRYVNNPYSPEIELSNTPVGTSVTSELNKIETNEVQVEENHKQALQFTKRYYRDAKETMEMLADSLLSFSGAINPITVATMQMLVGDESLQYRFVNSKTNPVVVNHDISYNSSTKVLNAPAGIIQHMTLGITSLSNTHAASDYKYWDMAEYNSPSLTNPEKKFYLYAKCSKDNQSGTFLLSETAIALEQIDGYYHLLVGILNSENNGKRSFATLYGFTEILPGRITTDKIVSSDGKTYFDLLKGEIAGYIRFLDGLIGTVGIGNETTINAGMSGEGNADTDVRIWAGADKDGRWDAPYRVLHNGKLIGTDVDLKGKIDADSGNIGDFNISDGAISISRPNSGNGVLSMNLDVNGIALHNTSPSINVKMGLQQVQITDKVFYTPVFMEGRENFCGIYIRESFTDSNAIGVYSKYASIVLDNSPLVMQGSCPLIMYGKAVPAGGMYNNVWCTNQGGGTYEYYLPSSSDNRFGQMGSTIFVQNMNGDAWINTRNGETLRTLNGGSTTRWAFKNQYRLAIFHKLDYSTWTVT